MALFAGAVAGAIASIAVAAPLPSGAGSASDDAMRWLVLVDKGEYQTSWQDAGELFRSQMTEADWISRAGPVRKPLGAVVSRKLGGEKQAKDLPNAPAGDYDIIQYNTDFANRHGATETLVLKHEPVGWRVEGYFIK